MGKKVTFNETVDTQFLDEDNNQEKGTEPLKNRYTWKDFFDDALELSSSPDSPSPPIKSQFNASMFRLMAGVIQLAYGTATILLPSQGLYYIASGIGNILRAGLELVANGLISLVTIYKPISSFIERFSVNNKKNIIRNNCNDIFDGIVKELIEGDKLDKESLLKKSVEVFRERLFNRTQESRVVFTNKEVASLIVQQENRFESTYQSSGQQLRSNKK